MTSTANRRKAIELASRPYTVTLKPEKLKDGSVVYLARVKELLGCMAQGTTRKAALAEIESVLTEYIQMALEEGWEIAGPSMTQSPIKAAAGSGPKRVRKSDLGQSRIATTKVNGGKQRRVTA